MTTVEEADTAPPVTGVESDGGESRRRPPGLVWLAVAVGLIAVGVGAWLWTRNVSTEPAPVTSGPVATTTVERGTISATDSWEGTLDHGEPFTVTSSREGTITWVADQGATVERGDALFRVDELPVTFLNGGVPMFRDLGPGDSGADVLQLEANLAELGYEGFTVDGEYTSSTAQAVRAWQADIGTEQTGTVARGDVVFAPEAGQVDARRADVGDVVALGRAVLDITGIDQVVSLQVDIEDRDRFEVDTEVTVLLPGGDELAGTVAATAVVGVAPEGRESELDGGGTNDPYTESVLQVEIAVTEEAPEEFVGAPVEVVVAIDERTDALLVPVDALLALAEGGFGLEIVRDDGTSEIAAVTTGLFADGRVEVSGDGIAEGTVVGVAGR